MEPTPSQIDNSLGPMRTPLSGVTTPDQVMQAWNAGKIDDATAMHFMSAMQASGAPAAASPPSATQSAAWQNYNPWRDNEYASASALPSAVASLPASATGAAQPQAPAPADPGMAAANTPPIAPTANPLDVIRAQIPSLKDATDYDIVDKLAQTTGRSPQQIMFDYGVAGPNAPGFMTSAKNALYGVGVGVGQAVKDVTGSGGMLRSMRQDMQQNPVTLFDGAHGMLKNAVDNFASDPVTSIAQLLGGLAGLFGPTAVAEAVSGGTVTLALGAAGADALTAARISSALRAGVSTGMLAAPSYGTIRDVQNAEGKNSAGDIARAIGSAVTIGAGMKFMGEYPAMFGGDILPGVAAKGGSIASTVARNAGAAALQGPLQTYGEAYGEGKLNDPNLVQKAFENAVMSSVGGALFAPYVHLTHRGPVDLSAEPGQTAAAVPAEAQAQAPVAPVEAQAPVPAAQAQALAPIAPAEAQAPAPRTLSDVEMAINTALKSPDYGEYVATATKTPAKTAAVMQRFDGLTSNELEAFADKSRSPALRTIAQSLADIRRTQEHDAATQAPTEPNDVSVPADTPIGQPAALAAEETRPATPVAEQGQGEVPARAAEPVAAAPAEPAAAPVEPAAAPAEPSPAPATLAAEPAAPAARATEPVAPVAAPPAEAPVSPMFTTMFDALRNGQQSVNGVPSAVLVKAKPLFDAGLIKTPAELQQFATAPSAERPATPAAPAIEAVAKGPQGDAGGGSTQAPPAAKPVVVADAGSAAGGIVALTDVAKVLGGDLHAFTNSERTYLQMMASSDSEISGAEMAKRMGVTPGRISQIQKAVRTKLAAHLGVSESQFRGLLRTEANSRAAEHDSTLLGMSPDKQVSGVDLADLDTKDAEGEGGAGYQVLDSVGQAKSDIAATPDKVIPGAKEADKAWLKEHAKGLSQDELNARASQSTTDANYEALLEEMNRAKIEQNAREDAAAEEAEKAKLAALQDKNNPVVKKAAEEWDDNADPGDVPWDETPPSIQNWYVHLLTAKLSGKVDLRTYFQKFSELSHEANKSKGGTGSRADTTGGTAGSAGRTSGANAAGARLYDRAGSDGAERTQAGVLRNADNEHAGLAAESVGEAKGSIPPRSVDYRGGKGAAILDARRAEDAQNRASGQPGGATDEGRYAGRSGRAADATRESAGQSDDNGRTGRNAADANSQTPDQLTSSLAQAFGSKERLARAVSVARNERDPSLPADLRRHLADTQGKSLGVFYKGRVYLMSDHIPAGREMGVVLHELGVHAGWRTALSPEAFKSMTDTVKDWAARPGDSAETQFARAAIARVDAAEKALGKPYTDAMRREESLAYFVEEAVKGGVDPREAKGTTPLGRVIRRVWAAAKAAAAKLGLREDKLDAQSMVDFAYGAANKALDLRPVGDAETAHTFGGLRAENIDNKTTAMAEANRMRAEGRSDEEIWQKTGWWKNPVDGKWRFEIDDSGASFKPAFDEMAGQDKGALARLFSTKLNDGGQKEYRLSDVLDHPALFEHYPHLADMKITRTSDASLGDFGYFNAHKSLIDIAADSPKQQAMSTLMHELQHAIQSHEMTGGGSNPDAHLFNKPDALSRLADALRDPDAEAIKDIFKNRLDAAKGIEKLASPEAQAKLDGILGERQKTEEEMDRIATDTADKVRALRAQNLAEMQQYLGEDGKPLKGAEDIVRQIVRRYAADKQKLIDAAGVKKIALGNKLSDLFRNWVDSIEKIAGQPHHLIAHGLYQLASGEVESRNVQARMELSKTGRGIVPPSATQDVSSDHQYAPDRSGAPMFSKELDGVDPRDVVPEGQKIDPERTRAAFSTIDRLTQAATSRLPPAAHTVMRQIGDSVHETLAQGGKRLLKGFMSLRDLQRAYGHIDGMNAHVKAMFDSGATVHREQLKYARVHDAMMRLPLKTRLTLGHVMEMAKRLQVHPDLPLSDELNKHLGEKSEAYDEVSRAWAGLGREVKGTEAQEAFKAARDVLRQNWLARRDLLSRKAQELGVEMPPLLERNGPYFPSTRDEAPYAVVWRSPELAALDKSSAQAQTLKSNPDHYFVSFEPTMRSARRTSAELAANGKPGASVMERAEYQRNTSALSRAFMDKLESTLQGNGADSATIKAVRDLYLSSLPDTHSVTSQMSYGGVAGIRPAEMIHGFARAAMSDSFHYGSLKHGDELARTLMQIKENDPSGSVYNLMQKRFAMMTKASQNKFATAAANFTYLNMLGSSPAFLTMQGVQPWMLGLPLLAAKDGVGLGEAVAQLGNGTAQAMRMVKLMVQDNGWHYELGDDAFTRAGVSTQERHLLNSMLDNGLLDMSGALDFSSGDSGLPSAHTALMKAATIAPHMIEQIDRMGLALATHRALLKAGRTHEEASAAAHDIVASSMFDYSRENTPYLMMPGHLGGLNRLFMQFRKYQQGLVSTLVRNFAGAMHGDKEAMRATFGLLATHALMAGAAGLPVAFPIATLSKMVSMAWPSDDRPDPDAWFAHYLNSAVGTEASLAIRKGLPALLGVDLSNRLGAGDIFNPVPFAQWSGSANDSFKDFVASSVAPVMGTVSNTLRGYDAMTSGHFIKGAGMMMPKFVADMAKAYDLSRNGIVNKYGSQAISPDDVSAGEVATRALGFQPTQLTEYYDTRQRVSDARHAVKDARSHLIGSWVNARMRGDSAAEQDARREISEFNGRHSGWQQHAVRINSGQLFQALQRQRLQSRTRSSNGVTIGTNEQWLNDTAQ